MLVEAVNSATRGLMLCAASTMQVAAAGALPGTVAALNATASGADGVLPSSAYSEGAPS
jgi:hypothetical protein